MSKESLNPNKVLELMNLMIDNGDIILLKGDGLRDDDKFTVVLTSGSGKFETIRRDGKDLGQLMVSVYDYYNKTMNG